MADDTKVRQTHAIPPSADPAEAIERLVSRRQLRVETGDVVVTRIHGSKSLPRESYELHVKGGTGLPERFATFEDAATRGELLALQRRTRLFLIEADDQTPSLLRDARRL